MSNLFINIRFYYFYFQWGRGELLPGIGVTPYWKNYYSYRGARPKEKLFEVYKFDLE